MHIEPMKESDGGLSKERPHSVPCPKCRSKSVVSQVWESLDGGYEDYKITCKSCGHVRWIDGIDS